MTDLSSSGGITIALHGVTTTTALHDLKCKREWCIKVTLYSLSMTDLSSSGGISIALHGE